MSSGPITPVSPVSPVSFAKGHGTGNDFVIIPDPEDALDLTPEQVVALCDRRTGIGGDGVLRAARSGDGWFMDYRNADGSVAEMCGNGARVFAHYLLAAGWVTDTRLTLQTRSGPVPATVHDDGAEGAEALVSVTLRPPRVVGAGVAGFGDGRELSGVAVDCGNPHLVCPLPPELPLAAVDLTTAPVVDPAQFPAGVNVEVVEEEGPEAVRVRVYERGVGETRSCGSGACAVAMVALRRAGHPVGSEGEVAVSVPGGRLTVDVTAGGCVLTGPAVLVATGTLRWPPRSS